MVHKRFAHYTWGILLFNIFVILWGVLVRATGSGAGCGDHWPTCNGSVLPSLERIETFIEFFHRLTTGIDLPLVLLMLFLSYRLYPPRHRVRNAALFSTGFIIIEALIGAVLVRYSLVTDNDSAARAVVVAFHLANTFLLLGAMVMTAWWASGGAPVRLRGAPASLLWTVSAALLGTLLLGANGAITALGDTLHLATGIQPDNSPLVATLMEMRIVHPLMAVVVGGLIGAAVWSAERAKVMRSRRTVYSLLGLFVVQFLLGGLNVMLQAPIWLQVVHLFVADLIWILLVLSAAQWLAIPAEEAAAASVPRALREAQVQA